MEDLKLKVLFNGPFDFERTFNKRQIPFYLFERRNSSFLTVVDVLGKKVLVELHPDLSLKIFSEDEKLEKKVVDGVNTSIIYLLWAEYELDNFYERFSMEGRIKLLIERNWGARLLRSFDLDFATIASILLQDVEELGKGIRKLKEKFGEELEFEGRKVNYLKFNVEELSKRAEEISEFQTLRSFLIKMREKKYKVENLWNKSTEKIVEFFRNMGVEWFNSELIALYGFGRSDTFPINEEIKSKVNEIFGKNFDLENCYKFVRDYFGNLSSIFWLYLVI